VAWLAVTCHCATQCNWPTCLLNTCTVVVASVPPIHLYIYTPLDREIPPGTQNPMRTTGRVCCSSIAGTMLERCWNDAGTMLERCCSCQRKNLLLLDCAARGLPHCWWPGLVVGVGLPGWLLIVRALCRNSGQSETIPPEAAPDLPEAVPDLPGIPNATMHPNHLARMLD